MSDIFRINLNKLKFVYIFSALLCAAAAGIMLVFAHYANQFPHAKLLRRIAFGALIALPIFFCSISIVVWFINHLLQQKFFEKVSDSHLNALNFVPVIINIETRWKFAERVYLMKGVGSKIILRQNKHQQSEVEFCFFKTEQFAEHAIDRAVKMTKKEFYRMTTADIKLVLLQTTLS